MTVHPNSLKVGLRSNLLCLQYAEVTFYGGNGVHSPADLIVKNLPKRMCCIFGIDNLPPYLSY